jgi:hypothetical protein
MPSPFSAENIDIIAPGTALSKITDAQTLFVKPHFRHHVGVVFVARFKVLGVGGEMRINEAERRVPEVQPTWGVRGGGGKAGGGGSTFQPRLCFPNKLITKKKSILK